MRSAAFYTTTGCDQIIESVRRAFHAAGWDTQTHTQLPVLDGGRVPVRAFNFEKKRSATSKWKAEVMAVELGGLTLVTAHWTGPATRLISSVKSLFGVP